ncbi:hypothetical protein WT93_31990 [Burkholderia stagnalis]|nr:hypothetical protein WT93_31990 [Burkholderia stagnalis]
MAVSHAGARDACAHGAIAVVFVTPRDDDLSMASPQVGMVLYDLIVVSDLCAIHVSRCESNGMCRAFDP